MGFYKNWGWVAEKYRYNDSTDFHPTARFEAGRDNNEYRKNKTALKVDLNGLFQLIALRAPRSLIETFYKPTEAGL